MRSLIAWTLPSALLAGPAFGETVTLSAGHPAGVKKAETETDEAPVLLGIVAAGIGGVTILALSQVGNGATVTTGTTG